MQQVKSAFHYVCTEVNLGLASSSQCVGSMIRQRKARQHMSRGLHLGCNHQHLICDDLRLAQVCCERDGREHEEVVRCMPSKLFCTLFDYGEHGLALPIATYLTHHCYKCSSRTFNSQHVIACFGKDLNSFGVPWQEAMTRPSTSTSGCGLPLAKIARPPAVQQHVAVRTTSPQQKRETQLDIPSVCFIDSVNASSCCQGQTCHC